MQQTWVENAEVPLLTLELALNGELGDQLLRLLGLKFALHHPASKHASKVKKGFDPKVEKCPCRPRRVLGNTDLGRLDAVRVTDMRLKF